MDNFVEVPNLPRGRVSLVLVDRRIDSEMENNLRSLDIDIIKTKGINETYEAVSYHPDIMVHHLGGNKIIAAPNINQKLVYKLEDYGFIVIPGKSEVFDRYPFNIAYNAARVSNKLICNVKYTDEVLLDYSARLGLEIINVKQGYSKCSICVVDEKAVITSDNGIYNKLKANGIDCLLIESGSIMLPGMNYGFIGGASGYLSHITLGFFGDMILHPNYDKIYAFLIKYNKKILNLGKNIVVDLGTLIPLKEYSILSK